MPSIAPLPLFDSLHVGQSQPTTFSGTTLHSSSCTSERSSPADLEDFVDTTPSNGYESLDEALRGVGTWAVGVPEPEQHQASGDAILDIPVYIRDESDDVLYSLTEVSQPTLFEDEAESDNYAVTMADGWTASTVDGPWAEISQEEGSDGGDTVCEASGRGV